MLDDIIDHSIAVMGWDWRLTTLGTILSVFITTRIITTLRSNLALQATGNEKTPPIVPYVVPGIGNMFDFAFDTRNFLGWMM
jgi:hypothetical protein